MEIEVIVQNVADAIEAEKFGADRLELVSTINEGGLTPSYETIKETLQQVGIPVQVMIRPHSKHFYYTETDITTMLEDINNLISLGGNRIVFGALNKDDTINQELLTRIVQLAPQLDITFHRAFDEVSSQQDAYYTLCQYRNQVKRILTSGGAENCDQGQTQLKQLVKLATETDGPAILPGSGLDAMNIAAIHSHVGASQYHFGKGVRKQASYSNGFDQNLLLQIRRALT